MSYTTQLEIQLDNYASELLTLQSQQALLLIKECHYFEILHKVWLMRQFISLEMGQFTWYIKPMGMLMENQLKF